MLLRPRYVIAVPDLARSAAWYRDVLGFSVAWQDVAGWRLLSRGGCMIMAGECPDALPAGAIGDHSYFAYLEFPGPHELDAFHDEALARGAEIVKPLRDEPWGMREFGVRTVDGHRMMFGAPSQAGAC